jgi:hypothetical protein
MRLFKHLFVLAIVAVGAVALGSGGGEPGGTIEPEGSSIDHLPEQIQEGILAWRARLQEAKVLKVTTETNQTWVRLHALQPDGSPTLRLRERFHIHSWMTPDSVWAVIFGYKGDVPDTEKPIFQMYWNGKERTVWERTWIEKKQAYRVRKYPCDEPVGPGEPGFGDQTNGCIFATTLNTKLAGEGKPQDPTLTIRRHPNLAMVPPDPKQAGIWLDVFQESVPRNQIPKPGRLYRRQDFMLLARNEKGEPEVREWRTLVLTDETDGGKKPTEITGTRRFQFDFYDQAPPEVGATVRAFVADVEAGVAAQPAEEVPTAPEPPASPAQPAPR